MPSFRLILHIPFEDHDKIHKLMVKANKKKGSWQKPTNRQHVILALIHWALQQEPEISSGFSKFAWVKGSRPQDVS